MTGCGCTYSNKCAEALELEKIYRDLEDIWFKTKNFEDWSRYDRAKRDYYAHRDRALGR